MEHLLGENLLLNSKTTAQTEEALKDCHVVALYFGAHWAPPCRLFTKKLERFYSEVNKEFGHFQVVYISDDGSKEAFNRTYDTMGWLATPFEKQDAKLQLKKMFGINGIPHLHVVEAHTGQTLAEDASDQIQPETFVEVYSGWLKRLVAQQ